MAEPFIGEVDLYGFNFTPEKWLPCTGQLLAISSNQAMFSLLGTQFGGDGRTTFGIPDLRGKMAISQGTRVGTSHHWNVGDQGGQESQTLSEQNLPQHNHTGSITSFNFNTTIQASTQHADADVPKNGYVLAGPETGEAFFRPDKGDAPVLLGGVVESGSINGNVTIDKQGANNSFGLLQPSQVLNYCIAQYGLFPSRS